ncbi:16S rRNA methyltransferase [Corynebacterium phocae]|uniref:Ribosomal RNA small subunit methyltransferase A n=1 Tax=Corynebacterium phocae TaxID=161895 RepID=A0A1L7D4V9_9CORY|nr:16S rRNA (adenine(1518)-N(6)/adenine(1519)-N(6))-dimethyltransferase RsmA [Corynebacterium phocae]APT92952.1 16S rRNA methyltransferase [Corynebacterium phocae]KAA8723285.1 16S rRNA (adenine(1518)-N(6)/adenine(1519)-N(6))-dimethyltransferase RsmA [Corynebacterium phocae]
MSEPVAALLGPVEIRALASELDVTPTKKLGQNFLHDPNTIRRIVAAAELSADDKVVEVGPGLGSLTLGLLEVVSDLTVVEIDPRLAQRLPQTVTQRAPGVAGNMRIIEKDALKTTAADVEAPTALVANLPYNVSVPVLLHFLATFPSIKRVLVMVQLEVADRLAASPGSKVYGVPSVKASYYGNVYKAGNIGKNVFWPAPNIDSGLVRIDCFEANPWPVTKEEVFPLIDAAFAQRRKTLRAALAGFYGSAPAAEEALLAANIDPKQRGEKIAVEDFVRLAGVQ